MVTTSSPTSRSNWTSDRSWAGAHARTGDLLERCQKYYVRGGCFAKWRTALKMELANNCLMDLAIEVAAEDLARYACICQEVGLVPNVVSEIMIDSTHDIQTSVEIQEKILTTV